MRVVVVFPLVPVMAAIGIRDGEPLGNNISSTAPATSRGVPSLGETCIRKPGAAFTSQMPPPTSLYDWEMSGVRKSTPHTSRPTAAAARMAISRLSGWQSSVRSIAVPPVERLPVVRR